MLHSSHVPLTTAYDVAMLDLDGVVYTGPQAVPGAAAALRAARQDGIALAFITNNASRPPEDVAAHLTQLGIAAAATDVVTSAQAAARVLVDRFGVGARVACLGGPGLSRALQSDGLVPVGLDEDAVAVVSGFGPDVRWSAITTAAVRIRGGLPWVASNTDATFPTVAGLAPGHGVLVDMLARFTGVRPTVAGKPERPLLDETVRRTGSRRPLMVGDRLDTDIAGANRAGMDSLLVLTGVSGLEDLVAAPIDQRPTYLALDLHGLRLVHPESLRDERGWRCGAARAVVDDGQLRFAAVTDDTIALADAWRASVAAAWAHLDDTGEIADLSAISLQRTAHAAR